MLLNITPHIKMNDCTSFKWSPCTDIIVIIFDQRENCFIALSFELEIKIRSARFIKCFKPVEAKMKADLLKCMFQDHMQSLREATSTHFSK